MPTIHSKRAGSWHVWDEGEDQAISIDHLLRFRGRALTYRKVAFETQLICLAVGTVSAVVGWAGALIPLGLALLLLAGQLVVFFADRGVQWSARKVEESAPGGTVTITYEACHCHVARSPHYHVGDTRALSREQLEDRIAQWVQEP